MFSQKLGKENFSFRDLRHLLGAANEPKSGDVAIGVSANSEKERIAAKYVVSELTLKYLYENPSVPYETCEVTRYCQDHINHAVFCDITTWTVGELREFILKSNASAIEKYHSALTPEMVASVIKISSNMDLMAMAQKLRPTSKARFELGRPGTLSSRLQPNHPNDSIGGILASTMEGLSYGCGDALIGVNPAIDSVDNTIRISKAISDFIMRFDVPTAVCVLSHVTTQLEALKFGAPLDIVFQSIAGNESTNRHFGVNVSLLCDAASQCHEKHNKAWPNVLYFETGQGSELSLESHEGVDQVTLEARTYGLARLFKPYMVNNVSGFIGPEILFDGKQMIRANLEDLAMGKLLGLPMGMAPCYTTHADIDQNDHQIATTLLALSGSLYFMALPQNEDVMLSYQDTSFHDNAVLRQMLNLKTTPEFEAWMEKMHLYCDGKPTSLFGDVNVFGAY